MPYHFAEQPTNRITNDVYDNVTRTAEYKVCAARVTKIADAVEHSTASPAEERSP